MMGLEAGKIIFQAAKDAIVGTRRVLFVVSGLIGVGFFYLFLWYGSWELARIEARRSVARAVRAENAAGRSHTGERDQDYRIIREMEAGAAELERDLAGRQFDVPIVGVKVASADFSVALLIVAVAVLLWLLFYQRRLNRCLHALEQHSGWEVIVPLLEHHFTLVGARAPRAMRSAGVALFAGLPALSVAFLASDLYDVWGIADDATHALAFESPRYCAYLTWRLAVDAVLSIAVLVLGLRCHKEFCKAEDHLLKFADLGGAG